MKNYELILHYIQNGKKILRTEILDSLKELYNDRENPNTKIYLSMILYGMSVKGPESDELLGLVDFIKHIEPSIFDNKVSIGKNVINVSGSGKKGVKTFNISTLASIVAAASGCYISKAISNSVSSITGSADIALKTGVNTEISHINMIKVLKETGLGMFRIEKNIPIFDAFYGGLFLVPHALSYSLAALANPIKCESVIYGFSGSNTSTSAKLLKQIGFSRGAVISSTNDKILYIDELTPLNYNNISYISDKDDLINFNPTKYFPILRSQPNNIASGKNILKQKIIFQNCLSGKGTNAQNSAVSMNAALILLEAGIANNYSDAYKIAIENINNGIALKKFNDFVACTNDYRD